MIAIDTNVLVRVIVEDTGQSEQTNIARELVMHKHSFWFLNR